MNFPNCIIENLFFVKSPQAHRYKLVHIYTKPRYRFPVPLFPRLLCARFTFCFPLTNFVEFCVFYLSCFTDQFLILILATLIFRPPKCESSEVQANSIHKIANARDRNSFNKIENLAFYNRHKPSSVKKHSSDTTLIHKKNIDDKSNHLPENHVQNPAFAGVKLRDRPGRTERRGSKDLARNSTFTPSFYQREASPVVPPQSFYVVQEKKDFPGEVVVRRGVVSKKSPSQQTPPTNYRHSIFTEQPTTYQAVRRPPSTTSTPRSKNDRSNISWIQSTPKRNHESGSTPDNNRSMSTPDSEVAERNRRACKMMMHFSSNIDEFLDDIETTIPYHL